MHSLYLPDRDCLLRWHAIGQTDPVVLWLPGLGMPAVGNFLATATDPALPPLRALMVDLPGSGSSEPTVPPLTTVSGYAACVAALLDHLGHRDCIAVGYSMGGSVAVQLALDRPDLVAKLVLAEANLVPGGGSASRRIAGTDVGDFVAQGHRHMLASLRAIACKGHPLEAFIAASWQHADPASLHGAACALVDLPADLMPRLLALKIPRTFVYGGDTLAAVSDAGTADAPAPEILTAAGIAVRSIDGTGHALMLDKPAAFARIVAEAVSGDPLP